MDNDKKHEPAIKTYMVSIEADLDKDIAALALGMRAMELSSPRMRRSTLNYLYDKYVTQAEDVHCKTVKRIKDNERI
jgi:hypothetical protein